MIYLTEPVIAVWRSDVTRWCQRETGGVLLGYETLAGDVVITDATRAGPEARRGWFGYTPDLAWDAAQIAEAYEASGRIVTYLGEWHAHPFGRLRPSHVDATTLRYIAAYEEARVPRPISAIVTRTFDMALRWTVYRLNADGDLLIAPTVVASRTATQQGEAGRGIG